MTGIMTQDRRLAGIAIEERKGLIVVGNKWDLVREQAGDFSQRRARRGRSRVDALRGFRADYVSFGQDASPARQPHAHRRARRGESRPARSDARSSTRSSAMPFWRIRRRQLRASSCASITRRSLRRIRHSSFFTATTPNSCNRITSVSWKTSSGNISSLKAFR